MFMVYVLLMCLLTWLVADSLYCLGMPVCEAFAQIEQQPNIYDVVHVKYFDEVCHKWLWL